MAEIVIQGSGSGFATADRFSTSIALLVEPALYMFDCGEPCSALLYRNGIDPLALRTVFISHMHPDHVGGLASLLFSAYLPGRPGTAKFKPWSIHRSDPWYRAGLAFPRDTSAIMSDARRRVTIVMPSEGIDAIRTYLSAVYLDPSILPFDLDITPVGLATHHDGVVGVTAVANDHLRVNAAYSRLSERLPQVQRQSYSFRVEVGSRCFVFSGDLDRPRELEPLLKGHVDTLILEVAHFDPVEIRPFANSLSVRRIVLTHIHPGLEERLARLVAEWADPRFIVARDGLRLALGA